MKPEHYELVEALFDAVLALPAEERRAYLDRNAPDPEVRRQVEAMLDMDASVSPALETPAMGSALRMQSMYDGGGADPRQIGRYCIIRRLGAGGMGIVYEAEQDAPKRRVALKVMRSGGLSRQMLQRFEVEAHVLGQLHHPGIAQIYESGVAHDAMGLPQPYFAMELIKGRSLTEYMRARGKTCTVRQRLALIQHVAEAVHHAHQKGVIHRDLKPDNILVDEHDQPKVLDFGVARALDSDMMITTLQTDAGQIIGTLAYMSPEQVSGRPEQVDTRSDVYALGAIMYEALTGQLPLNVTNESVPAALRMIQEQEPRRLSQVNTRLRGDLETIVAKAMEKEKTRRYQSAIELAADIGRYLNDEPIVARRASTAYQFRKFAKRNKALVGGTVAVFVVLVAALLVSTSLYLRSERNLARALEAEQDALHESAVASEVSDFLTGLFTQSNPWEVGADGPTARDLLDRGAERIQSELETGSAVRARLMHVMGNAYYNLGQYADARSLVEEAFAIHAAIHEPAHPLLMQGRRFRAQLEIRAGNIAAARELLNESLEHINASPSPDPKEHWNVLNLLSGAALTNGDYREALEFGNAALSLLNQVADDAERGERLAATNHMLGVASYYMGRHQDAERHYLIALDANLQLKGDRHPAVATGYSALGLTLMDLGRLDEAERLLRKAVEIAESIWGAGAAPVTPAMNNLALTLHRLDRLEESEAIFRQLLDAYEGIFGSTHHVTLQAWNNLASVLTSKGEFDAAEELLLRTRAAQMEHLGQTHPETLAGGNLLARLYERTGRWAEAEAMNRSQRDRYASRFGETDNRTLTMMGYIAENLREQGRFEEAVTMRQEELRLRRDHFAPDHPRTLDAVTAIARLLHDMGLPEKAAAAVEEQQRLLHAAGLDPAADDLAGRMAGFVERSPLDDP